MRKLILVAALLCFAGASAQAQQVTQEIGGAPLVDFTVPGCTVGTASAACLAAGSGTAQGFYRHVQIQNASAAANIACSWGGAAALNTLTSVQLGPGQSALWGPATTGVPLEALNCIASAASTPLYLDYN